MRAIILLCAGALLLSACSRDTSGLTQPDASVPIDAATAPDAAASDAGGASDAAAPDASAPVRALVDRHLFGTMPPDNAIVDPSFDLASYNWYALSGNSLGVLIKHSYAKAPTGQPAIEVPKAPTNSSDVVVYGNVTAVAGPAEASVSIGRHRADQALEASATVIFTDAAGQAQAVDLLPDTGTATVATEDLVWRRYQGRIATTPIGISGFTVSDTSEAPFFLTGPVVRSASHLRRGELRPLRPLEPREAQAVLQIHRLRRDQFKAPRVGAAVSVSPAPRP